MSLTVDGLPRASSKQVGLVVARMRRVGLTDRDAGLAFCARVACRPISSRSELTADEASWVLTALDTWHRDGVDPTQQVSA
ncbi:hypothetical protein [Desertihabitans brevis]|uniref:hypothetical protein n=1 Tax=Desertihabitans brevis TaxID=2268447 RepID=UPI0011BEB0CE|nr:hypothetical protein [Desertihabitans brevis]